MCDLTRQQLIAGKHALRDNCPACAAHGFDVVVAVHRGGMISACHFLSRFASVLIFFFFAIFLQLVFQAEPTPGL